MTQPRRPQVSPQSARQLAADHYGLRATARELPSYDDRNFLLEDSSGNRSILKVSTADQRPAVELQNSVLIHLQRQPVEFQLPRVCPASGGSSLVEVVDDAATPCVIRRLTFVAGRQMAELDQYRPELLSTLGRALGKLDKALASFDDPSAERRFEWDLRHAAQAGEHIATIPRRDHRALAEYFLLQFRTLAEPRLAGLRQSVIHSDANIHNVLVDEHGDLAGFIDFGDVVKSSLVCDPAIAAAYAMIGQEDPLATGSRLIAGYHGEVALDEEEVALLFPLLCARLTVSVILGARERRREPDNPHVGISSPAIWPLMRRLRAVSPRQAEEVFRIACGFAPGGCNPSPDQRRTPDERAVDCSGSTTKWETTDDSI